MALFRRRGSRFHRSRRIVSRSHHNRMFRHHLFKAVRHLKRGGRRM